MGFVYRFWTLNIYQQPAVKLMAYLHSICILLPLLVEVPPGNISCSNHPSTRSRAHRPGLEEGKNQQIKVNYHSRWRID